MGGEIRPHASSPFRPASAASISRPSAANSVELVLADVLAHAAQPAQNGEFAMACGATPRSTRLFRQFDEAHDQA